MIRQRIRNTAPYESRRSLNRQRRISHTINKFSNGLGGLGQENGTYTPLFTEPAKNTRELIDKYYIPSHRPPIDILTELGNTNGASKTWIPIVVAIGLLLLLFKR